MRFLFLLWLVITGCTTASKLNHLKLGMNKDQVLQIMGEPYSTSAADDIEYLNYQLSDNGNDAFWGRMKSEYFVRLKDGKVNAFGQLGDFNSTRGSAIDVNIKGK